MQSEMYICEIIYLIKIVYLVTDVYQSKLYNDLKKINIYFEFI